MKTVFKWLLFSSIPVSALTIILSMNWSAIFNDARYEATSQAGSYYEQNRPALIDDIAEKFSEISGSTDTSGEDENNSPLPCRNYQGKVVAVTDGDTITVADDKKIQHKIRFRGIDAPEAAQDFGDQSKKNLAALVFGKKVVVETCETDRFYPDREISLILLDNQSVNEMQVRTGLAHYYKEFSRNLAPEERMALAEAETDARHRALGLWANPQPTLPKDFRRLTRAARPTP